jgi:hypothetical protein
MTTGGSTPVAFTELNEQLDVADRTMLRGAVSEVCAQIASLPKPEDDFRQQADYEAMQKLPPRLEALLKLCDEQLVMPWQEALHATISLLTVGKKLREDSREPLGRKSAAMVTVRPELMIIPCVPSISIAYS